MVTIQNLDVRFEVEGEDDNAAFKRLFEQFIQQWQRQQDEQRARQTQFERELGLGLNGRREGGGR